MSLISTKNFLTPFSNTVNLVTIVVLALLFGIYRLAGGGVYTVDRASRGSMRAPVLNSQQVQPVRPQQQLQRNAPTNNDPFADLLKPSPQKQVPVEGNDELQEIERQLGLKK